MVGRIALPGIAGDMATLGRGRWLAIADRKASQVRFVDVLGRRVERVMDVPLAPDVLRSNSTGTTLAALDLRTGKISSSTESGAFQTVPDISGATYIVFDAKGRLLAAHQTGVAIVDATGHEVAELAVDRANGPVTDVAADPGNEYAFVEQPLRSVLSIFDVHSAKRLAVLHLPAPLRGASSRARIANSCLFPQERSRFQSSQRGLSTRRRELVSVWNLTALDWRFSSR